MSATLAVQTKSPHHVPASINSKWLIVPGKRVGPITRHTTINDLKRIYGARNLKTYPGSPWGPSGSDEETVAGEDTICGFNPVDTLYEKKADEISFCYSKKTQRMISAYVYSPESHWVTASKIRVGTTLQRLKVLNGGAFQLIGWVSSVKVEPLEGKKLSPKLGGQSLTIQVDEKAVCVLLIDL